MPIVLSPDHSEAPARGQNDIGPLDSLLAKLPVALARLAFGLSLLASMSGRYLLVHPVQPQARQVPPMTLTLDALITAAETRCQHRNLPGDADVP